MTVIGIADASRRLSKLVNQAAFGQEIVVLTSRGQAKAVLLGIDTFEQLVGAHEYKKRKLMPLEVFRERFRAAMAEEGYESREDILALVREVKREQVDEETGTID
jgi:prevent-host-death family protein